MISFHWILPKITFFFWKNTVQEILYITTNSVSLATTTSSQAFNGALAVTLFPGSGHRAGGAAVCSTSSSSSCCPSRLDWLAAWQAQSFPRISSCTGLYRVVKTSLLLNLPKELEELAVRVRAAGEGGHEEEVEKKLLAWNTLDYLG